MIRRWWHRQSPFFRDAVERTVRTFVQGGLAGIGGVIVLDLDMVQAFWTGGATAVLTMITAFLARARWWGTRGHASFDRYHGIPVLPYDNRRASRTWLDGVLRDELEDEDWGEWEGTE